MKRTKFSKLVIAASLCTAFTFVYSAGALAAAVAAGPVTDGTPTVTLTATASSAQFGLNRETNDLFDNLKDVVPGDTLTQRIEIKAADTNPDSYKIYLYAANQALENGEANPFFEHLQFAVKNGEQTLSFETAGEGAQGVLLGTFAPGATVPLDVSMTVSPEMGNEFQNASGIVDWRFYAEQDTSGGGGGGGDDDDDDDHDHGGNKPTPPEVDVPDPDVPLGPGTIPDGGDGGEIEITEPDVPLSDLPEIDIEEKAVPLSDIPKTGDHAPILPLILLMIGSGTALAALLLFGKREEQH